MWELAAMGQPQGNWDLYIPPFAVCHESTKCTPPTMIMGRDLRLPVDLQSVGLTTQWTLCTQGIGNNAQWQKMGCHCALFRIPSVHKGPLVTNYKGGHSHRLCTDTHDRGQDSGQAVKAKFSWSRFRIYVGSKGLLIDRICSICAMKLSGVAMY